MASVRMRSPTDSSYVELSEQTSRDERRRTALSNIDAKRLKEIEDLLESEPLDEAELFEHDYLKNVLEKPYRSAARRWVFRGGGLGGVLFFTFGPLGMLTGGLLGMVVGICAGLLHDLLKMWQKQNDSKKQIRKINHLMRFAEFHFASSQSPLQLVFKVISEYQALSVLGGFSKTARQQLRLLHHFIRRDDVQCCLEFYLDYFFKNWRRMTRSEISMCHMVCAVCVECCRHVRVKRPAVVERMGRILDDPAISRLFMTSEAMQRRQMAQALQGMDCLLYTDAPEEEIKPDKKFMREFAGTYHRTVEETYTGVTGVDAVVVDDNEVAARWVMQSPLPSSSSSSPSSESFRRSVEMSQGAVERESEAATADYPTVNVAAGAEDLVGRKSDLSASDTDVTVATTSVAARHETADGRRGTVLAELPRAVRENRKSSARLRSSPRTVISDGPQGITESRSDAPCVGQMKANPSHHVAFPSPASPPERTASGKLRGFSAVPRRGVSRDDSVITTAREKRPEPAPPTVRASVDLDEGVHVKRLHSVGKEEVVVVDMTEHRGGSPTLKTTPYSPAPQMLSARESKEQLPEVEQHISKKRLFRSFSDMVNFDADLKHQTPINSYELDFLDEKESHDTGDNSWELTVNRQELKLYKYKSEDDPVVLIKAYATLRNIPVGIAVHHIRHIPTRLSWDTTFSDFIIVEKDVDSCEVIYCTLKAPWPITARDFLQWRRTEYDTESDVCKIVMRSASHPRFPLKSTHVRAETIISGYVVRPLAEDPKNSSRLFVLAQTDVKGLIPKWMVNTAAQRSPVQWVEGLKKASIAYMKKHGRVAPSYIAESGKVK